jgi:hypothetical protein
MEKQIVVIWFACAITAMAVIIKYIMDFVDYAEEEFFMGNKRKGTLAIFWAFVFCIAESALIMIFLKVLLVLKIFTF